MEHLQTYVYLTFGATVIFTIWLFYKATNYSKPFLLGLIAWIIIQSALGISGFYSNPNTMTARFPLLILPPLLFLVSRLVTKSGRAFLDGLNLPMLTILHVIRIPVEIVLFWLFINNSVPEAMTFHGRNFDILSGISAPLIYYFGFVKKTLSKKVIIAWNLICLALLLNVVSAALLSLPARFIQFGFEQPNIALGYFPFVLLPALLVPLVMLSTVAAIKQLIKNSRN
ncbi:hypothetical protein EZ449_04810 [Pedobacter frigidisoli]|uniref:Uncharacterized protein n=1 Tax=Pedobacter frigidisoli TaxID=2530455 RepID=A0A4R0P409_9SPHI|nr:hypothetical protein [Pedobacter frigidisoli]TCD11584.1 hypothetical protein EZ449_04810 [Pedobacter frigidisoli]